jgi:leader peptidase (prepilin peptidase)/N-methyltransferase
MEFTIFLLLFIFGTLIGSFLNVVILRLPKSEKLTGRSHCTFCKKEIAAYDLIPAVSYLALGGKCRNCKTRISSRYFIIEIVTGAIFVFMGTQAPLYDLVSQIFLLKLLFSASILLAVFVIDLEHFLILDSVLIAGIIPAALLNFLLDVLTGKNIFSLQAHFAGGIVAGIAASAVFFALWFSSKGRWMGFGDVKLVFLLGILTGWPYVWVMLLLAFFLGTLISLPLLVFKKKQLKSQLPFGTFLSVSALITMLYGQSILSWYLSLIGWQ